MASYSRNASRSPARVHTRFERSSPTVSPIGSARSWSSSKSRPLTKAASRYPASCSESRTRHPRTRLPLFPSTKSATPFNSLNADWRTEILAGFTTFMTMAYIIFVNPSILHESGMPLAAVTAATCISAAVGSLLMGGLANYPIALAPGMGLNAYFTYVVVKGMGVPWQVALGAVFISGVAFLVLTLIGVRQLILSAIPPELYAAVAAGVGLFIAFIGFRNSGIIVPDPSTTVKLG